MNSLQHLNFKWAVIISILSAPVFADCLSAPNLSFDCPFANCAGSIVAGANVFRVYGSKATDDGKGNISQTNIIVDYACVKDAWERSSGSTTQTDLTPNSKDVTEKADRNYLEIPNSLEGSRIIWSSTYHEDLGTPFGSGKFKGKRVKVRAVNATASTDYDYKVNYPSNAVPGGKVAISQFGGISAKIASDEYIVFNPNGSVPNNPKDYLIVGFWLRSSNVTLSFASTSTASPLANINGRFSSQYNAGSVFSKTPVATVKATADLTNGPDHRADSVTVNSATLVAADIDRLKAIFGLGDEINNFLDAKEIHSGWDEFATFNAYVGYATGGW